ncbi:MAG: FtsW/RodA/SpoVE family cell cycle protein [Phycisphaeraceae bacterium]|nr:FtsW/RodA/SpoVE family cell cycle protein [Phycisphaerales bacterium]QOJ16218.1 MAG: FtsW/RodA/SpoVE family cell cycle protein [Phycisphaeraceae bacterium]
MLRPGQGLVIFAVALLIFGVVMVNSAGLSVQEADGITLSRVLTSRPMIYALLAGAMLAIGACVPVRRIFTARGLASPIPWLTLATLVLLLAVYLPGLSREMNGSKRWLNLGGVSFQPSEFAKWTLIILLAWHGAKRAAVMHRLTSGFLPGVFLIGLVCLLIGVHDLGTAVLVGLVGMAMLVAAGVRWWQAGMLVPVGAAAFTAAVIHSPYRINRLLAYVNPFDDPQGIGYHVIQSMSAVSGGGLAGRGLGNGVRKFGYLPEDTTDFIFAIICEELGIFGAALVLFLYGGLVVCGLLVARRVSHPFLRLVALGVVLTIGLQAAINIAVVTGVAPTKGIALPLLSHGGTGWALTAFSIGLLVSMDRRVREEEEAEASGHQGIEGQEDDDEAILPAGVM